MKKILYSIALALLLTSCGSGSSGNKYIAQSAGNPYEIFVIADKEAYKSDMMDSLKSVLREDVEWINFAEPSFDLYNIYPEGFTGVTPKHRNLLFIQLGKEFPEAKFGTIRNKYASPQLLVVLEAPDTASMQRLILDHRYEIKEMLEDEELSRFTTRATKFKDEKLSQSAATLLGLDVNIPKGYKLRNQIANEFLWISNELPEASQGLLFYEYPFSGTELTDTTILSNRNKYIANVPGQLEGSYMSTSGEFAPETRTDTINGRKWYITKGFWRVENDFQGGPFVSYSTIDEAKGRVVVVDGYVYSPNPAKKQRNFLRQIEGIIRTAKIK